METLLDGGQIAKLLAAMADTDPFLIAGGGIGGLAAAYALARKGFPVRVFEQAPEFKEIGAGIQLGPNVFRMFEVLGLTEQMFHWCAFPEGLEFRDSITAETIVDMKIDKPFHDKYHAPYGVIHRADMLNVILDACKKLNLIKLAISQKVVTIDNTGSGVTVKTETGETYQARHSSAATGFGPPCARRSSATASRLYPATSPTAPCFPPASGRPNTACRG